MSYILEDYMIPCMNKKIFGMDCMGCGFQRATALILSGDFKSAFFMYPAIYPIGILLAIVVFNFFHRFKYDFQIKIGLIVLIAVILVVHFFIKVKVFL